MKHWLCTVAVVLLSIAVPALAGSAKAVHQVRRHDTSRWGKYQVQYTEGERADSRLSFFMDREGSLYPPASIIVDDHAMLSHRPANEYATLKAMYRDKSTEPGNKEWAMVLGSAHVTPNGSFDQEWTRVQGAYLADLAAKIKQASLGADDVVLLIHGFNNNYIDASNWYGIVEQDFGRYAAAYGHKVVFIRMYWNGLVGPPLTIWGPAQANGPWVGLGLRRLLNLLDADLPLRVFTHSSGAFVITNALGDGSSAFPNLGEPYPSRAGGSVGYEIPKHLRKLRLAMLVPAQPLSAFSNFIHEDKSIHGLVPDRLILGVSKYDFATGKSRLFTSCNKHGSTCMTTHPQDSCRTVWGDLDKKPLLVNFDQPWFKSHLHAVVAYMRDRQWQELVRGLLADSPGVPAGERLCDKPIPTKSPTTNKGAAQVGQVGGSTMDW